MSAKSQFLLCSILLCFTSTLEAQLITWSPQFPSDTDNITITFDATKGNAGLQNYLGDVYIYTGLITSANPGPGNWRYVKSPSFNTPDPAAKMTALGNNKYSITINPRSFYPGLPASEQVLKLAMIFRNADGSRAGRTLDASDNGNIYLPVYDPKALSLRFISPEFDPKYIPLPIVSSKNTGDSLLVTAIASQTSNLTLQLNNTIIATASGQTITAKAVFNAAGTNLIKAVATNGTAATSDSFGITVNAPVTVAPLPANIKDGITYLPGDTSVYLNLYAPGKKNIYVLGDFNNWQAQPAYYMMKTPDSSRFWIRIDHLTPGKEYTYQYLIDGQLRIADPYCEKVVDPYNDPYIPAFNYPNPTPYPSNKTTGIVSVLQTAQPAYSWQVTNFKKPAKSDLLIYELHVRDFLSTHDYTTLKDTLNYLQNLGINTIELMPINEFEGNDSWGYNPSFYFAPDKYYGTKNNLKAFIDECHKRGLAVVLDMVLNHSFGQSPMVQMYFDRANNRPAIDNPWFNPVAKHAFNVGYDFNHESPATQYFVDRVTEFWLTEYKVDGFRFDLSKGFTQKQTCDNSGNNCDVAAWGAYDQGRIDILSRMANAIWSKSSDAYVILEHFAANEEEKVLADKGMLLWGNLNDNYAQAAMGYGSPSPSGGTWDLSNGIYKQRGWANPNLITYMESHDEERLMYKNLQYGNASGNYSVKDLSTALKRQELVGAFFFTLPGPKMMWEFGELGYDQSINRCPDGTINSSCRTADKPILWNYLAQSDRKRLHDIYALILQLRKKQPTVFRTSNFTYDLSGAVKTIQLNDASLNISIVGNFDVISRTAQVNFQNSGTWYDYITGKALNVQNTMTTLSLQPGEYHIYTSKNVSENLITATPDPIALDKSDRLQVDPNPVSDYCTIRYQLFSPSNIRLSVVNMLGQECKLLLQARQMAGMQTFTWNRNSNNGTKLPAGIYLLKLLVNNKLKETKIMLQ